MTSDDAPLEARLKSYIEAVKDTRLDLDLDQLAGSHLINDLAMDSLDIINFLFRIEESEGVDISEADMESESLYEFSRLAAHVRAARGG